MKKTILPQTKSLPFLVNIMLAVEKLRVATQVRCTHLSKVNKADDESIGLRDKLKELEDYVDGRVGEIITDHPAWSWLSRVKGVGRENVAKVIGLVDIKKAEHVSSLWRYAGFHVVNGKAPRRKPGEKTDYNSRLRSMCWRLATSLLKAKGEYYRFYLRAKEELQKKCAKEGTQILPTPIKEASKKRIEPEGVIWEGHIHNQALRRMIKLFLSHLWTVWRQAEGLQVTQPYAHSILGHEDYLDPWKFAEK